MPAWDVRRTSTKVVFFVALTFHDGRPSSLARPPRLPSEPRRPSRCEVLESARVEARGRCFGVDIAVGHVYAVLLGQHDTGDDRSRATSCTSSPGTIASRRRSADGRPTASPRSRRSSATGAPSTRSLLMARRAECHTPEKCVGSTTRPPARRGASTARVPGRADRAAYRQRRLPARAAGLRTEPVRQAAERVRTSRRTLARAPRYRKLRLRLDRNRVGHGDAPHDALAYTCPPGSASPRQRYLTIINNASSSLASSSHQNLPPPFPPTATPARQPTGGRFGPFEQISELPTTPGTDTQQPTYAWCRPRHLRRPSSSSSSSSAMGFIFLEAPGESVDFRFF